MSCDICKSFFDEVSLYIEEPYHLVVTVAPFAFIWFIIYTGNLRNQARNKKADEIIKREEEN